MVDGNLQTLQPSNQKPSNLIDYPQIRILIHQMSPFGRHDKQLNMNCLSRFLAALEINTGTHGLTALGMPDVSGKFRAQREIWV